MSPLKLEMTGQSLAPPNAPAGHMILGPANVWMGDAASSSGGTASTGRETQMARIVSSTEPTGYAVHSWLMDSALSPGPHVTLLDGRLVPLQVTRKVSGVGHVPMCHEQQQHTPSEGLASSSKAAKSILQPAFRTCL